VKQEENKNCVSVMGGKREPPRRKVLGLANDCSNGIYIGATEEELNSQKTLKKNVLKVFFEGGRTSLERSTSGSCRLFGLRRMLRPRLGRRAKLRTALTK
jgi:hypothetical protein